MKHNYELLQNSGLNIFITNQSSRYSPSIKWGNDDLERFLSLTKKLQIDLLYAFLHEDENGDPILQELGFHHNEIYHFFAPSIKCSGLEEEIEDLIEGFGDDPDRFSTNRQEEQDLKLFLEMDSEKILTEIISQFKNSNISNFESLESLLHPYWNNLGIDSECRYYPEEILNKLNYINSKVAAEFNKEVMVYQLNLQKSDVFRLSAITYFQENKFKSIKKVHLKEYLKSVNILTNLTPLVKDSLLNTINDGLKVSRNK